MSSQTPNAERERDIERFVHRSALATFLLSLAMPLSVTGTEAPFRAEELAAGGDDLADAAADLSGPFFDQLWPDEKAMNSREFALAHGRELLQVARLFSGLAGAERFLRQQADVFRMKAAEEFRSAQEYAREGEKSDG